MNYRILVLAIVIATFLVGSSEVQSKEPESVKIGEQVWMAKNLDVDQYQNGDPIPQVADSAVWENITIGAWCYYDNDPKEGEVYGKLYNWYAVNDKRGLAPVGYHIPSNEEWMELSNYLGGDSVAGIKMKEKGTTHWAKTEIGLVATNESSFSALPGGFREYTGTFYNMIFHGFFWSSTEANATDAWLRYLNNMESSFNKMINDKGYGYSVRCIKD